MNLRRSNVLPTVAAAVVVVALGGGSATVAGAQTDRQDSNRGMQRMHELMQDGNPGMTQMHEQMMQNDQMMQHHRMTMAP